jgi:hypothetical protein
MSQIIPIYIPTFISDQNYNPARVLPHVYFYNGLIDCEQYWIESGSATFGGVTYAQTSFPYFDNYNVVTGSFPTTDSDSLLFNNEGASYGEVPTGSLYTNYWETYISLLYNPTTRLVNCSAIIPLKDYFTMELNDILNFRGNYYHLRAINDYSLKDGSCNLQLLGPIISDTFSSVFPEPEPLPTGSTEFATASINLNELNSGSIFIDANIIVSGSPYYFSGNFTQYVTGGVVANVVMEGKDGGSTVWGGYTTASATLAILDNGTPVTSSTQYIYSGSGDTIITFSTTFPTGHIITISGSTAVVGDPTPPPTASLTFTVENAGVFPYPVTAGNGSASGTLINNTGNTIYVYSWFNSGGNTSGNTASDSAQFSGGSPLDIPFTTISGSGQTVYSTTYETIISDNTTKFWTVTKNDGLTSGATMRLGYATSPGGTITALAP